MRVRGIEGDDVRGTRPHEQPSAAVTIRRGRFWLPGESVTTPFGTVQRGPVHVEWEAPPEVSQPYPLVLVHGGGGQATDWKHTPDGRPGWVDRLVAEGFAVYLVDRIGFGRSPAQPAVAAAAGPAGGYESAVGVFAPPQLAAEQTQWPWGRTAEDATLQQFVASSGTLAQDAADAEDRDGERLAQLLDRVGPAVLITHSAGALSGWQAAARRPGLVAGIVAVEPVGPPFMEIPGIVSLRWGLTAGPIVTDPVTHDPAELRDGSRPFSIPGIAELPIAVVTASASPLAAGGPATVDFLRRAGARAELVRLEDHGIVGNGHGLMFEANSDETVVPVVEWIRALR
jgi:pimeloyl-ACP methyl ester carboxylesterase